MFVFQRPMIKCTEIYIQMKVYSVSHRPKVKLKILQQLDLNILERLNCILIKYDCVEEYFEMKSFSTIISV